MNLPNPLDILRALKILQPINVNNLVLHTFQFLIKMSQMIIDLARDKFRYIFIIVILLIIPTFYRFAL